MTFKNKDTETLFRGFRVSSFSPELARQAYRKLKVLQNAITLNDLLIPPSNNLEALKGKRKGQFSIRINGQWRICFIWHDGNVYDVEIVDYH